MSSDRTEEAEAVIDSAEMTLEAFGGRGASARKLETKVEELRDAVDDPDQEVGGLIEEVRDLMEDVKTDTSNMQDDGMPDDGMPPI